MGSILTTSVVFFSSVAVFAAAVFFASSSWMSLNDRIQRLFGQSVRDEFLDLLLGLRRRILVVFLAAQLTPNLVALDRHALEIIGLDLFVEPWVVENLDLGLGDERPEDQGKTPEQEQPQPGGRRRPAGTVRLPPTARWGRPARSFLLRRSILHASSLSFRRQTSHAVPKNPDAARHPAPDDRRIRIVTSICQKLRGIFPVARRLFPRETTFG